MIRAPYKPLAQGRLPDHIDYYLPDAGSVERLRLDSPAVEVMTDLLRVPAATVSADLPLDDANRLMLLRSVRSLLVTDGSRRLLGIITATDLLGEKPMQRVCERGVRHRDLLVRDIMTPRERLEVMQMRDVAHAEIGDIVATLSDCGRQHALVVDADQDGRPIIRGIFSTSSIARELGVSIQTTEVARTFAEIEAAIAH